MWRVAVVVMVLAGCGDPEEDEECPNSSSFDCGRADDWWHPPRHSSFASLDEDTLVCARSEYDTACGNAEGDCCCGGTQVTNRVSTVVDASQCSSTCAPLDEAACRTTANCFIARETGTNTYIGCFAALNRDYPTPCPMRDDAEFCIGDDICTALYASTGANAWQFSACTDE